MRYDCHNLSELRECSKELTDQDRLVIFTDGGPIRLRVFEDGLFVNMPCDVKGDDLSGKPEPPVGEMVWAEMPSGPIKVGDTFKVDLKPVERKE